MKISIFRTGNVRLTLNCHTAGNLKFSCEGLILLDVMRKLLGLNLQSLVCNEIKHFCIQRESFKFFLNKSKANTEINIVCFIHVEKEQTGLKLYMFDLA